MAMILFSPASAARAEPEGAPMHTHAELALIGGSLSDRNVNPNPDEAVTTVTLPGSGD